jgi:hypothetical protein
MQLIYCYIENFRNIQQQEVSLSDKFKCSYKDGRLLIEMSSDNSMSDYIYENDFMRNLRIIIGKTGSGKTNFLQMIGMDTWNRMNSAKGDAYFMLYKMEAKNEFFVEIVGMSIHSIEKNLPSKRTEAKVIREVYRIKYDFENQKITEVRKADYEDVENTFIVNAFDRNAFADCPYENERQEGVANHDNFIGRMITQFGNASVSMECDYLKAYLNKMPQHSIKRKASLVIRWNNWQDKHGFDLDEHLMKREYWTYKDKAEEQRENNARRGKPYDAPIEYPKKSTPKSRFLHDLMTDFAIYLRKCAECVDEEFTEKYFSWAGHTENLGVDNPRELPDGEKMSILKRIDWLCQYIDYHTDEMFGNKGVLWQIGDDIKDLFYLLGKMDDRYFTDEEFSIPAMDIDMSEGTVMRDVFERMEQYRPDQIGIFTKSLLPYHWAYVSSGEYQYAKVWGILEEYGVKVKVLKNGEKFSEARQPDFILLLDEPENYMHPEMCRTFIHDLNKLLKQRNPKSGFQVILSTHSPFMLSDVLANQIIKMDYDDKGLCVISHAEKPTYAANIHSIMADSFFLKYTIGEQARLFLTEKFELFKDMQKRRGRLSDADKNEIVKMQELLPNIGDELIRHGMASIIEKLQ